MARRFTRPRGRLGSRRETMWIQVQPGIQNLSAAVTPVLITQLNAAALALRPFTVIRTRGFFGVRTDQVSASESFDASLGYSVVSDQAAAVGVTAVPTPESDRGSDLFFVYESIMGRFNFVSAVGMEGNILQSMQFDSKAMRKVNDDQTIVSVIESSTASATGPTVHDSARILIKLH